MTKILIDYFMQYGVPMLQQTNKNKNDSIVPLLISGRACRSGSSQASSQLQDFVKVISYNIHYCVGTDNIHNIERIADVINESGAEIIGLNEVDNEFSQRSNFINQAKRLADKLKMHHIFGAAVEEKNGEIGFGNVILSKYKPDSTVNYILPKKAGEESRACLSAVFSVNDKRIRFLVTHLDHIDAETRKKQINCVLQIALDSDIASVIVGDFNHEANAGIDGFWSEFRRKFHSAFDLAGTGEAETFYGTKSKVIDFIFTNSHLAHCVKKSYVFRSKNAMVASDHLPLIAEIVI
jgi:endonuclease/exonuclease/phosphatase family metal-dependent hydrolase